MKIIVININDDIHHHWRELFEKYRTDIILNSNDKKKENYTKINFNVENNLGTFLMFDLYNNKIAAITSVFRNKSWPIDIARICNRTWLDHEYRSTNLSGKDKHGLSNRNGNKWGITYAYKHQINCCRSNNINIAIISRENNNINSIKNTMRSSWLGLIKLYPEWIYDDDNYYLTCNNENIYKCWQKLVWLNIDNNNSTSLSKFKKISNNEYKSLFYKKS